MYDREVCFSCTVRHIEIGRNRGKRLKRGGKHGTKTQYDFIIRTMICSIHAAKLWIHVCQRSF
jgi:hypothetical protein